MDIPTSLLIIGFAALIHATFQLSVSVLTMLSGHAIGAKRSHSKLMRMTFSFIAGGKIISSEMLQRSRKANIWLSALSMGTTILGLGVVEPLLGMLWTKRHEQNKQAFKDALEAGTPFPFNS